MENKIETSAEFFLSSLSHEIRTPLNGIVGYSQLLSQTRLDSSQQLYINSINKCCLQLIELVNDILDFSRLATGNIQINEECFSFNEVIEETNSALLSRIKEKNQSCDYVISTEIPEYIICDKRKIIQILINLISNSNKFTPVGGRIIINFDINENKENSKEIKISVEDNGIGISKEEQKKLFNPFFQIQDSLIQNGCGLGLAICYKLVKLLRGDIWVESELKEGTIVHFTFPFKEYVTFKLSEREDKLLRNKNILVLEADEETRLYLADLLFECNAKPILCSSIRESTRLLQNNRYNFSLVLIDTSLVNQNTRKGLDISDKTREIKGISCIGLTNSSESKFFETVIKKPINKIKFLDVICSIISRKDISSLSLNTEKETKVSLKETKVENVEKETSGIKDKSDKIRILIAEDVGYNMDMLKHMLNSLGYNNLDYAKDGQEAIDKIEKNNYDILLLDLKMPIKNGFEVAEYIKENNLSKPKICVITGSVLEKDRERCKELNVKYFILKPFNMSHLKAIMEKIS